MHLPTHLSKDLIRSVFTPKVFWKKNRVLQRDIILSPSGVIFKPTRAAQKGTFMANPWQLVGGWTNPFEKYAQVKRGSSSPSFGVKIKKYEQNHHPGFLRSEILTRLTPQVLNVMPDTSFLCQPVGALHVYVSPARESSNQKGMHSSFL